MHHPISILISPSQAMEKNGSVILVGEVRNSLNRNKGNSFIRIEMPTKAAKSIFGRKLQLPYAELEQFDYSRPSALSFGCIFGENKIKNLKDLFVIGDQAKTINEIPSSVARIHSHASGYTLYMIGRLATDVGPFIAHHTDASKIDDDEVAVTFGKPTLAEILRP